MSWSRLSAPNDPETKSGRERMVEVERGVETIIQDLEARVEKAEATAREKGGLLEELEKTLKRVEEEVASARTRAESAESTLEGQGELGGKLLEVNGNLAKSTAALHDLQSHVEQLEDEIADADQNLRDEQWRSRKLQDDLKAKDVMLEDLERKLSGQTPKLQESDRELQDAKAYITELEADAGLASKLWNKRSKRLARRLSGTTAPLPHSCSRMSKMPSSWRNWKTRWMP